MSTPLPFLVRLAIALVVLVPLLAACDNGAAPATGELPAADAAFDADNVTVMLDGSDVIIESNGRPNHTSPYWSNTTERCLAGPQGGTLCTNTNTSVNHPLFVAPTTTTTYGQMSPGNIDDFDGSYTLTVPASPTRAASSSATGLGPIGIAVSGAMIYDDQEGRNVPLDNAIGSFDANGAHTGPQSYHYHLEPVAISQDDATLVGVRADGFFLYGRRDADGTHPGDLDASGGHTGPTPHDAAGEDHYREPRRRRHHGHAPPAAV